MPRESLKSIKKKCDELARTLVMLRAGAYLVTDEGRRQWWGACERCHKTHWLSWCHVFTRAILAVRWEPDNAFAWCAGCHRYMDQHWNEKRDAAEKRIGAPAFSRLELRARAKARTRIDATTVAWLTQEVERARARV